MYVGQHQIFRTGGVDPSFPLPFTPVQPQLCGSVRWMSSLRIPLSHQPKGIEQEIL